MNELDIWHDNKSRPPPQPTYAVVCGGPLGWAGHEVLQEGSGPQILGRSYGKLLSLSSNNPRNASLCAQIWHFFMTLLAITRYFPHG